MIKLKFQNGKTYKFKSGITVLNVVKKLKSKKTFYKYIAAYLDNKIVDLHHKLKKDHNISLVTIKNLEGLRIYQRSLVFVLIRAVKELFKKKEQLKVLHSISGGLYCELKCGKEITPELIKKITVKMQEIIDKDEPFIRTVLEHEDWIEVFKKQGSKDKVELAKYLLAPALSVYSCGWLKEYFYGSLVPSTGYLKFFHLKYYPPGFIIRHPSQRSGTKIPKFHDQAQLFKIFNEHEKWGEILNINTVSDLNRMIQHGRIKDLIIISEVLHEKKIGYIADKISELKDSVKMILIAGPSSSGKTTFAKRLSIHLKINGFNPIQISLDDYFVDRDKTPLDEKGEHDFEAIEAIDIKLFNKNLNGLLKGKEVQIPTYNFKTGQREWEGHHLKMQKNSILIIEGIHGLNPALTPNIDNKYIFKIYVSALTQLNVDKYNRIPTTDTRILRRIVRDSLFRNYSAVNTIKRWPSVRRGEDKYIFPYQENADIMFNSALIYEIAILKRFAEQNLRSVTRDNPQYSEATRLLKFLGYFIDIPSSSVPQTSILKEFIGKSSFHY